MDFPAKQAQIARHRPVLEGVTAREGLELVALEIGGTGSTLRVSVDGPQGVGIDDCARLSHAMGPLLDVEDPFPHGYELEVSSPGIDRPLQRLEDFQRFAGYRAKIRLAPDEVRRNFTGRLVGVAEGLVTIEVDGVEHRLDPARIDKAHLVLDTNEYQRLASHGVESQGGPR